MKVYFFIIDFNSRGSQLFIMNKGSLEIFSQCSVFFLVELSFHYTILPKFLGRAVTFSYFCSLSFSLSLSFLSMISSALSIISSDDNDKA